MNIDETTRHAGAPTLFELSRLGVTIFRSRRGWFWVQNATPWTLVGQPPVNGPFLTAQTAGRDCRSVLRKKAA